VRKALVADVCVSELGWELMAWQGHVHYLAQAVDYVAVCSSDYLLPLYAGFCHKFIGHRIHGVRDCHNMKNITNVNAQAMAQNDVEDTIGELAAEGYQVTRIKPRDWNRYEDQQLYVPKGDMDRAMERCQVYDVVIHARNRTNKTEFTGSNYPASGWAAVAASLHKRGLKICCIGTKEQAMEVPYADDMRGMDFGELMDLIAAARVVVGPSSGPMHLASLCRTPHVTWSHMRKAPSMGCNNRERYERVWNPFDTPVRFIPYITPDPAVVYGEIAEILATHVP
jgi:hypothetical protein